MGCDGNAQRRSNHLLCATGPAPVLSGIENGDRQIVPAPVASLLCTGWTLRPIVAAFFPPWLDVLQYLELAPPRDDGSGFNPMPKNHLSRHFQSRNKCGHLRGGDLSDPRKIVELGIQRIIGPVEPVPFTAGPVNPKRTPHRIAELVWKYEILLWKYLNSITQAGTFDREFQALCQIVDIKPAVTCE